MLPNNFRLQLSTQLNQIKSNQINKSDTPDELLIRLTA